MPLQPFDNFIGALRAINYADNRRIRLNNWENKFVMSKVKWWQTQAER